MPTRRHSTSLLAFTFGMTLLSPAAAGAQGPVLVDTSEGSRSFSLFNTCTGEQVSGILSFRSRRQIMEDGGGGSHDTSHDIFLLSGVGETSGLQLRVATNSAL